MSCSVKSSVTVTSIKGSDSILRRKSPLLQSNRSFCLPSFPSRKNSKPSLSISKPLHLTTISRFDPLKTLKPVVKCQAYEADRSEPIKAEETKAEAAKRLKIGVYFATWWALNVVFNIYNKKVLNAYPYPWLTSTLSLACGSLIMLISWATRIAEFPKTDFDFWKTLFPVSRVLCMGFCLVSEKSVEDYRK